jgi:hypothetical protein
VGGVKESAAKQKKTKEKTSTLFYVQRDLSKGAGSKGTCPKGTYPKGTYPKGQGQIKIECRLALHTLVQLPTQNARPH